MIETFLNVERLSAGQMELKREHFSATELVDQCVTRAQPLAERKNIVIGAQAVPDVDLSGDRELMEYAVYNLLTNAVKYSPPETRVVVSGGRARGELRLWVEDRGIGMDKQEVKRVFDRFYRGDPSRTRNTGVTGLGLAIAQAIAQKAGGSISIDSQPDPALPNQGTIVTVRLPIAE